MRVFARAVYLVLGALILALSAVALVRPQVALHPEETTALTTHLVREQAAGGAFIGAMALWCFFQFERRRPVHLALLLFTALFAAIHWAEYLNARRSLVSPLVNSAPFVLLAAASFGLSRRERRIVQ
ncbi:MAG TPA: hypothetical protein VFO11_03120 [Candidatus Polarisedimenticolaceae bacterium]|nr:hypothetical protein [Candidatus Polarisedimenticolaceae bacterium]